MANPFKYRADHVGSLLPPPRLLKAREDRAAGRIDADELRDVEDAAILEALAMQREAGTSVVTDGEFRRTNLRSNLADAVEGQRWSGDEAAFLSRHAGAPIKICLPGATDKYYPDANTVGANVRAEIEALISEGVKYIQLNSPGYTSLLDPGNREKLKSAGRDPDKALEQMLAIDVAVLRNIAKPEDVAIGMHLCSGNLSSRWLSEGGNDATVEKLFNTLPVDRFLLEFDDAHAGGFELLRLVPKNKVVVLGLISTKTPVLEDAEALLDRIDDAAKHVDGDFLAISPQCGFFSAGEGGNPITQDDQRRKLNLTVDVARMYWGLEI